MDCVAKDKQGLLFKKHKYVTVHPQKKCLVFLELTEKVSTDGRESFSRMRTWQGPDREPEGDAPPRTAKPPAAQQAQAAAGAPKAKAQQKTGGKKAGQNKVELGSDGLLTKALRLETAANKAQSDSMSVEKAIMEDPQWKKLKSEAVLTDLRQAKDLLQTQLQLPFWQKLRLSESTKAWKDEMTANHSSGDIKTV